jgi:hypothetical protein
MIFFMIGISNILTKKYQQNIQPLWILTFDIIMVLLLDTSGFEAKEIF